MKLSTKSKIQELLEKGKRWQAGPMRFYGLAVKGEREARWGILVPKKHIRKSVDRNRLKRLVRESWRRLEDASDAVNKKPKWDLLIRLGSGVDSDSVTQPQVFKWLQEGLR